MERGLYIAASGMLAEMTRQDQIANDLANASTPGYKADRSTQQSFGELLLHNTRSGEQVGALGLGVATNRVVTDLSPGATRQTDEPLDLAVQGDGYFAVQTAQGVRYTRNGQFTASPQGILMTGLGQPVLGQDGQAVRLNADGTVDATRVGVFAVPNARKQGDNLFIGGAAGRAAGTVATGALEASGADPARSMVDMIASFRAIESGQKVIQTIDETLGKAANNVGTLG
jgi:flagellar basal-body rod protein FlgG